MYLLVSHNINKCIVETSHSYLQGGGGGVNSNTSLIDHFSMPNGFHTMILDYFTNDSADNLSDHVPPLINFQCIVETVPNNPEPVMHSKPVWRLTQPDHLEKHKDKLNKLLYNFFPTDEMFMSSERINDNLFSRRNISENFMIQ